MNNQNTELQNVYYNRVMSEKFEKYIMDNYEWLIGFVKKHPELDFQTGFDQKQNKSWFSVYRGTSRILRISHFDKSGRVTIDAAESYMKLDSYPKQLDEKHFEAYLNEINENPNYDKYYIDSKGERKEGYYQTLISRRYTFENTIDDDFIIFDKEFVFGFLNQEIKELWNEEIVVDWQNHVINNMRNESKEKLPKDIRSQYGEIDLVGLTWDGDLIVIEVKKDLEDALLSPIQCNYYSLQFKKFLIEYPEVREKLLSNVIREMIFQKKRMGLIKKLPKAKEPPRGFMSESVRNYIVIGNVEKDLTESKKERFRLARRKSPCGRIEVFTCAPDGTLVPCDKFK